MKVRTGASPLIPPNWSLSQDWRRHPSSHEILCEDCESKHEQEPTFQLDPRQPRYFGASAKTASNSTLAANGGPGGETNDGGRLPATAAVWDVTGDGAVTPRAIEQSQSAQSGSSFVFGFLLWTRDAPRDTKSERIEDAAHPTRTILTGLGIDTPRPAARRRRRFWRPHWDWSIKGVEEQKSHSMQGRHPSAQRSKKQTMRVPGGTLILYAAQMASIRKRIVGRIQCHHRYREILQCVPI